MRSLNLFKRIIRLASLALSLAILSSLYGCATGANSGAMAVSISDIPTAANAELKEKVNVRFVGGGKETNPMLASQVDSNSFKTALSQSLRVAGYESNGVATYFVDAELQALSQPMFGLTFDVTSTVRYTLEGQGKRKIFPITAVGTATTSDALAGVERLRIANEKSIKENIKKFLNELSVGF
jgi:hypothetical protein